MVTHQIMLLAENIFNRGNIFGLDRKTLQVYIGEALANDNEPDILVNIDSYILLGGFIETFIDHLIRGDLKYDSKSIAMSYLNFAENLKNYEGGILANTKRYIDEINNLGNTLRKLGYKIRFMISERTCGVELYFMGRTEFLRSHADRKINEWLSEGINEILVTSPFEFVLYRDRFAQQFTLGTPKLVFYPELLTHHQISLSFKDNTRVLYIEPYETPVTMFPKDLRQKTLSAIKLIEDLLNNIKNLLIAESRTFDPPFSYEQIWIINPLVAVGIAKNILEKAQEYDTIITLRTSTAIILRAVARILDFDIEILDYVEAISRALLGE